VTNKEADDDDDDREKGGRLRFKNLWIFHFPFSIDRWGAHWFLLVVGRFFS